MNATNVVDEPKIWHALNRLEAEHWRDVDVNGGRSVHDLYESDGLFVVGPNRFEGREGIQIFYQWRRGRGNNTTRHIISNVIVHAEGERYAKLSGLITIYRGAGSPPLR